MTVDETALLVYRVTLTGEDLRALIFGALREHLGAQLDGTEPIHIYIDDEGRFVDEEDDSDFSEADHTLLSNCTDGPKVRFVVPVEVPRMRIAPSPTLAATQAAIDRNPPAEAPKEKKSVPSLG